MKAHVQYKQYWTLSVILQAIKLGMGLLFVTLQRQEWSGLTELLVWPQEQEKPHPLF